jgi:hypothetical protein
MNYCECCEYKTNLTANFKKHLQSKKHILFDQKSKKQEQTNTDCTQINMKELIHSLKNHIDVQDKKIQLQNEKLDKIDNLISILERNNTFNKN